MKHLKRCFNCKRMVTIDDDQPVEDVVIAGDCREHLFPVFLCSAQCVEQHRQEHEEGAVVK